MNYLALLACIAPLYLVVYTYKHDRTAKEPKGLIIKLFIFGCISIVPILIVESLLTMVANWLCLSGTFFNLFEAFIIAAVSEESFKFLFLKWGSWKNPAFDTSYDGIIYAVTVSMGFAIVENIEYCVLNNDISTVLTRSLLSIPAHCAFGVVMGVFYARAKMFYANGYMQAYKSNQRRSLFFAIAFHGIYDFCLMEGSDTLLIAFIAVMAFVYAQLFKTIKNESDKDRRITF